MGQGSHTRKILLDGLVESRGLFFDGDQIACRPGNRYRINRGLILTLPINNSHQIKMFGRVCQYLYTFGFYLGYNVWRHQVKLDIDACLLQPDPGNVILGDVREAIRHSGVAAYGIRKHTGFWRFVMLRHSVADDRWMVNIVTAAQDDDLLQPLAAHLMKMHPRVQAVVNNITARKAGIAVGEREVLLAGQPFICDRIDAYEFEISANSFFQTNTAGARQLIGIARRFADLQGDERVLDLYCGTGAITIGLSHKAREVVGIELAESAVSDARRNCRRNGVTNCRFIRGDILEVLPDLDHRPDVVVIDPPRAGMHKKVVGQVLDLLPPRIVYVSCNPATLARDLEMMKARYRVMEVQPVDMFPHTFHIESVARLQRSS